MQRTLIVLVVGILAVGCATVKDIGVHLGIGQPNTPEQKQQKALRDSVVGEYGGGHEGNTYKQVFLENGVREWYKNGKIEEEPRNGLKWSILDGEIHILINDGKAEGDLNVWIINADKSITLTAHIRDGKREDFRPRAELTWRRIK